MQPVLSPARPNKTELGSLELDSNSAQLATVDPINDNTHSHSFR